jgi:hypothetical protein
MDDEKLWRLVAHLAKEAEPVARERARTAAQSVPLARLAERRRQIRRASALAGWLSSYLDGEARRAARRKGPRAPHALACQWCSRPFAAKRSDARFCSGSCRVAAHRERAEQHIEQQQPRSPAADGPAHEGLLSTEPPTHAH